MALGRPVKPCQVCSLVECRICECCHANKRVTRRRECQQCRTGQHPGGVNCPRPDYGATRILEAEAHALAVDNFKRYGRREVGVKGYLDELRALREAGLVEAEQESLRGDDLLGAIEVLLPSDLRVPVMTAVRETLALLEGRE